MTFGRKRRDRLGGFLELPNGIPSHDTFERVFDRLKPQAFQACFRDWVQAVSAALKIEHIATGGKTLRGSGSAKFGPLHPVSAWATAQHLSLGQVAVGAKSNGITAIPLLRELLDLNGARVTLDAMGCQKAIAQKIVDQGGHYALTVKDNQDYVLEGIQDVFRRAFENDFAGVDHFAKDDNRVQKRNAAENLALLRRLTLSLLKAHPSKDSIAKKPFAAALDGSFLEEILRESRGEPTFARRATGRGNCFNAATTQRPWRRLVVVDFGPPVAEASMRPRPKGRGERGWGSAGEVCVMASMRPRPKGRGEARSAAPPPGRAEASMRPRPKGRGEFLQGDG